MVEIESDSDSDIYTESDEEYIYGLKDIDGLKDIKDRHKLIEKVYELTILDVTSREEIKRKTNEIFELLKDNYTFIFINSSESYLNIELIRMEMVIENMLPKYQREYGIICLPSESFEEIWTDEMNKKENKWKKNTNTDSYIFELTKVDGKCDMKNKCWECGKKEDLKRYNTINNKVFKFKKMILCDKCGKGLEECCYYCGEVGLINKTDKCGSELRLCLFCDICMMGKYGEIYFDYVEFIDFFKLIIL